MRKRDELTNPKSCMSRARDDEWTFVLLGRDVAAPAAIRAWMFERIRLGKNGPNDSQIREAEDWINATITDRPSVHPMNMIEAMDQIRALKDENRRLKLSTKTT